MRMNISNVLSTMWTVSQGVPFMLVQFRANSYEPLQLWHNVPCPIAGLSYSDIDPLVKLFRQTLEYKMWILVVVGEDELCSPNNSMENSRTVGPAVATCRQMSKLSESDVKLMEDFVDYLALTMWLIPRNTPIYPTSKLMCFVAYDNFTDVPSNYRECGRRQQLRIGQRFWPNIDSLVVADFNGITTVSYGMEQAMQKFLNLSHLTKKRENRAISESLTDIFRWLRVRDIDMLFVDFVYTAERFEKIAFTSPIGQNMLHFLSKMRTDHVLGSFGLVHIFDAGTWICVGCTLATFFVILSLLKHPDVFIVVIATQLNLSMKVRSRQFGVIMSMSGILLTCAFSSSLLSSLSVNQTAQIATLEDLLRTLRNPGFSVCVLDFSFFISVIQNPGESVVLQAFAQKNAEHKMIKSNGSDCLIRTRRSNQMVTLMTFEHLNPYVGQLFVGKEPIYILTGGMPISPGYPLMKQVNRFVGSMRETRVAGHELRRRQFNETMRQLQEIVQPKWVKPLSVHEFELFLFILSASWLIVIVIKLCEMCKCWRWKQ